MDLWTVPVSEAAARGNVARWRNEVRRLRRELRFAEARVQFWAARAAQFAALPESPKDSSAGAVSREGET